MRFVWAVLAVSPFMAVAVGMVTGRIQARSCCVVPAERDTRLAESQRDAADPHLVADAATMTHH